MCYEGGIREFVTYINRNKTPLHEEVIYLSGAKGDSTAEIAMQYNDGYNETLVSFANDIHTPEGGMHETGFKAALDPRAECLRPEIRHDQGGRQGLRRGRAGRASPAVISVKLTEAQFEGQTKAKLGNAHIRTLVDSIVSDQLAVYLEEHPVVARTILDKALTANRAREAARKARESIRRKTALGGAAMPDKLRDCNENNPELTELYIVEGDSAGGSATAGTGQPVPGHPAAVGQDAQRGEGPGGQGLRQRQAPARHHRRWAPVSARSSTRTSCAITRSSSWPMPMWTAPISAPCC